MRGHPTSQNFCKITKSFLACQIHPKTALNSFPNNTRYSRSAACAVALDDNNIFLLGGLTTPNTEANQTKAVLDSLVKMNSTGGWTSLSPMLQPRYHAACTTYTYEGVAVLILL